jgi:hypothetical protein
MLCAALGCDDEGAPAPAPSASAPAASSSAPAAPVDPRAPYRDEDLPVAPDYEAEYDQSVTKQNYRKLLAETQRELGMPVASASASASAVAPAPVAPAPVAPALPPVQPGD